MSILAALVIPAAAGLTAMNVRTVRLSERAGWKTADTIFATICFGLNAAVWVFLGVCLLGGA